MLLLHDAPRLAKRRRALRERNPPRNSQLETHRTDERWGGHNSAAPAGLPFGSGDRFPHASENSYRRLQRRPSDFPPLGLVVRRQRLLEFHRRKITQGRMQPLFVVDLFEESLDR